jgi:hypothetical protein
MDDAAEGTDSPLPFQGGRDQPLSKPEEFRIGRDRDTRGH